MNLVRALSLILIGCSLGCERPNPDEAVPAGVDAGAPDLFQPAAPGPAVLSVDDADFEFNPVVGAAASLPRTFTITNGGGQPSGVLTSEISGAGFAGFAISQDGCAGQVLGAGASCPVSVVVLSAAAGSFEAALRVQGDPGGVAKTRLRGSVVDAGLSFDVPQVDLGDVLQEQKSSTATLTLKNGGGATTGALKVWTSAATLALTEDHCTGATLAGGATCTVTARFAAAGDAMAGATTISVLASGAPGGKAAVLAKVNVLSEATVSVPAFDFGTIGQYYGTPQTQDLVIQNVGHDATTVTSTALAFSRSLQLTGDHCTNAVLAPNGTCSVTVRFDPRLNSDSSNLRVLVDHGHGGEALISGTAKHDAVVVDVDLSKGTGGGTVTAMDGQACSSSTKGYCEVFFPLTTGAITLTAAPDATSSFDEWTGECWGSSEVACKFLVPPAPTTIPVVVASFKHN